MRRALRRSFCAVRVFPFNVALAAPGPVPRGLARFALAAHSRLASTQEKAAAPRQREQRVSATLSNVEETQRQSAETRCRRCRSAYELIRPWDRIMSMADLGVVWPSTSAERLKKPAKSACAKSLA